MKRLTGRNAYGKALSNEEKDILIEKLCEYEDLEEEGKLLKFPCHIGDTIYGIFKPTRIVPLTIYDITVNRFGVEMSAKIEEELNYSIIHLTTDNTGIEWYKTKEEAEKSIKKAISDIK